MNTMLWTNSDATQEQMFWIDHASMCRQIQNRLLPHKPLSEIDRLLQSAYARGVEGAVAQDGAIFYTPHLVLEQLFFGHPEFFEDIERDQIENEEKVFTEIDSKAPPEHRRYTITQQIEISSAGLPDCGVLHLWLPAPQHIHGVQEVRLRSCTPERLAEHYIRGAGQFYNIPLFVDALSPLPSLHAEFEVTQTIPALRDYRDPDLCVRDYRFNQDDAAALDDWLLLTPVDHTSAHGGTSNGPQIIIDALINKMQEQFRLTSMPGNSDSVVARVLANGGGTLADMTEFLTAALRRSGFAAETGRGLVLPFAKAKDVTLCFPDGIGYDHAFITWFDPATEVSGTVDLSFLRRWSFAATADNVRSDEVRARLQKLGGMGEEYMRRRIYPGDLVIAGHVPQSQIDYLRSTYIHKFPAPVTTTITARRAV